MLTMDVFKQDAFSATSLTAAVDKIGYVPGFLGSVPGLFDPVPVRTKAIWIEERGTDAALIQTSERGEAMPEKADGQRDARPFKTRRLAKKSRITADELFGIREFGSETELKQLMGEVALRQFLLRRDMELTIENLKLGAVQGLVTDADGTTWINWASELGQTIPAEVDFDLDNATPALGALRKKSTVAVQTITRNLKGLGGSSVRIMALCGDNFWLDLVAHPEMEKSVLATPAAMSLRDQVAWQSVFFAGITFVNYRGTDDGTTVAIGTDKAKFFPVGAGIFQWAMSPGEKFAHLGQPGEMLYSEIVTDLQRDEWADVEVKAYPLPVCTMPQALYRARRT
jgi:hypothetical protein